MEITKNNRRKEKLIASLEKCLLLNFCIFLLFVPYAKRVAKVCFYTGVSLWLLINILKYKKRVYRDFFLPNPLNKPLFVFLVIAVISVVFSVNPYHSQSIFFERYLMYAILFWLAQWIVVNGRGRDDMKVAFSKNLYFLVSAIILSGVIFGLGGVFDYLRFHPRRLFTVFGNRIAFGMFSLYLVYYIPFCFGLFMGKGKPTMWFRIGGVISLILLIPCLFWQGSRATWIAVPSSLLIVTFIKNKKAALFLLLVFITCFILLFVLQVERMKKLDTLVVREDLLKAAVDIFRDYPVFGAGLGMYEKLVSQYSNGFTALHAHNTYLEIASEIGGVGLLSFLAIFVVFFKNAFRVIKSAKGGEQVILLGLSGSVIATLIFAIGASVITVGVQGAYLFWFLFGMASGLVSKAKINISG